MASETLIVTKFVINKTFIDWADPKKLADPRRTRSADNSPERSVETWDCPLIGGCDDATPRASFRPSRFVELQSVDERLDAQNRCLALSDHPADESADSARAHCESAVEPDLAKDLETASSLDEVLAIAREQSSKMSPSEAITAAHMVAKYAEFEEPSGTLSGSRKENFALLLEWICELLPRLEEPRQLSSLVWTLGRLLHTGRSVEVIVVHVADQMLPTLRRCASQELSNMLWGLARLHTADLERRSRCLQLYCCGVHSRRVVSIACVVLGECASRLQQGSHSLTAKCLSDSAWAAATLMLRGPQVDAFMRACAGEVQKVPYAFSSQNISDLLWAAAKLQGEGWQQVVQQLRGALVQESSQPVHAHELPMMISTCDFSGGLFTTAVLYNLSASCSQEVLTQHLRTMGFGDGSFDFLHIPFTGEDCRWALINFVHPALAEAFAHGAPYQIPALPGTHLCIAPAAVQGTADNVQLYLSRAGQMCNFATQPFISRAGKLEPLFADQAQALFMLWQ